MKLEFKLKAADNSVTLSDWEFEQSQVDPSTYATTTTVCSIPDGKALSGWQSTYFFYSPTNTNYAYGFIMTFTDGSTQNCGQIQSTKYDKIDINGPLRGARALLSSTVVVSWFYNACACDFSISKSADTLLLGESSSVTATLVTQDADGLYTGSSDPCTSDAVTISPSSSLISYSSKTATISTLDGGGNPIANAVGSETFTFTWTTSTGDTYDLTYDLQVNPACTYSAISWSPSVLPITLQVGSSSYTLEIKDFSHAYEQEWANAGFPNACTIAAEVGGTALAFSTVSGFEVTIAPDDTVEIGITTLDVTLKYSASQFEDPVPTNQQASSSFEILVSRAGSIETWPVYTIWGLSWANLALGVISLHLLCDKYRSRRQVLDTIDEKEHPKSLEATRNREIDLIVMD